MNTINSVYYGWAFLIACGAGSYYFAKRSINADRHSRASAENQQRQQRNRQIAQATHNRIGGGTQSGTGIGGIAQGKSPGRGDGGQQEGMKHVKKKLEEIEEKGSEFEAQRPFRSRKGDRFS